MKKLLGLAIDDEFTFFDMIGGDLIALGVVEVFEDLTKGRKIQLFCRPRSTKYFSDKAQEIHGISYFQAQTFPLPEDSMMELLHWLKPLMDQFPLKVLYYGAWNFDLKWIEVTMERAGFRSSMEKAFYSYENKDKHINVMKLAKEKLRHVPIPNFGEEKGTTKGQYKLDNVAKFYKIKHQHHDALSDADATADIFINIKKEINIWTGELI